jgi:hypothetical protein
MMDGAPGWGAAGRGGAWRAAGRGWTGAFGSSIRSRIEGGTRRPAGWCTTPDGIGGGV